MAPLLLFIPFVVKFLLYWPWCAAGIGIGDGHTATSYFAVNRRTFQLVTLRLSLGLLFGFTIWNMFSGYKGKPEVGNLSILPSYLILMLPTRWMEWGFIELAILGRRAPLFDILIGSTRRFRLWRIGGTLLGALADLVMATCLGLVISC